MDGMDGMDSKKGPFWELEHLALVREGGRQYRYPPKIRPYRPYRPYVTITV